MISEPSVTRAFFGSRRRTVARLRSSGFSGSEILLVEEAVSPAAVPARWVVKSFGRGTPTDRAAWVHRFMAHLRRSGIEGIPMLRRALPGEASPDVGIVAETLAEDVDGVLWEAVEFLPGRPIAVPGADGRADALRRLAAIHVAAAALPGGPPRPAKSRGLVERIERAAAVRERPWKERWRNAADRSRCGDAVAGLFGRAIEAFAAEGPAALERITRTPLVEVSCQAVLRDVWSDHLLFEGGRVSGFIDFHAAGIDTVATDLARLVGSWKLAAEAAKTAPDWDECLAAYERVRQLDEEERRLVGFLHHAGVIVAIDNWFRWLVEERRSFPDVHAVASRLEQLVASLPESIAALLRRNAGFPGLRDG